MGQFTCELFACGGGGKVAELKVDSPVLVNSLPAELMS